MLSYFCCSKCRTQIGVRTENFRIWKNGAQLHFVDDDDFDPNVVGTKPKILSDKWEGEDEDDDVKDSWDKDSSSEDEDSRASEDVAFQVKKKKKHITFFQIAHQKTYSLFSI